MFTNFYGRYLIKPWLMRIFEKVMMVLNYLFTQCRTR